MQPRNRRAWVITGVLAAAIAAMAVSWVVVITRAPPAFRSDLDCQLHESSCRWHGQCTHRDGKCIAARDADCARSAVCTKQGKCRARGGLCVNER